MKKITLIISLIMLLGSIQAQDTIWNKYQYNGHVEMINLSHVYNQFNSSLIDTTYKYYKTGFNSGSKIKNEVVKTFGAKAADLLLLNLKEDSDTQLVYLFALLDSKMKENNISQDRAVHLLAGMSRADNFKIGDSLKCWSNRNNCANYGIYIADDSINNNHILQRKGGEYFSAIKNSLIECDSLEFSNNW